MIDKLGGRKYFLTIVVILLSFVFVVLKMTDVESFFKFVMVVGGGYLTANVADGIVEKMGQ